MTTLLRPAGWHEALEARAAAPAAVVVAGGTDVLVEVNLGRLRPDVLLDLGRVQELRAWRADDGTLRLGAGVTYRELEGLGRRFPALAAAARTVGSPPIRNRGTIGGNIGSASPAGDCHPPLLAAGAHVEVASTRGVRIVPLAGFFTGPKRTGLAPDELISAVIVPRAPGPQSFSKVGVRNAMVIAVCSLALALDPPARRVGTGIGSAGPTPLSAPEAEAFLAAHLDEAGAWDSRAPLAPEAVDRFAELVAAAARPIDDLRGTARYRRHALAVLARRSLTWCWEQYREARP